MNPKLTRRQASALLGGMALAAPMVARASVPGLSGNEPLLVVLGDPEAFGTEIAEARAAGRRFVQVSDPFTAWRQHVGPELAQGRVVEGLGDAGFAFCLSQLARNGRHRFLRGMQSADDGAFRCAASADHLLTPALDELSSAWRVEPNSTGACFS